MTCAVAIVAAAVATVGLAAAFALNAHHGSGPDPAAAHRSLPPAIAAGPAAAGNPGGPAGLRASARVTAGRFPGA